MCFEVNLDRESYFDLNVLVLTLKWKCMKLSTMKISDSVFSTCIKLPLHIPNIRGMKIFHVPSLHYAENGYTFSTCLRLSCNNRILTLFRSLLNFLRFCSKLMFCVWRYLLYSMYIMIKIIKIMQSIYHLVNVLSLNNSTLWGEQSTAMLAT